MSFKSAMDTDKATKIVPAVDAGQAMVLMNYGSTNDPKWDAVKVGTLPECTEWRTQHAARHTPVAPAVVVDDCIYAVEHECKHCGAPMGVYPYRKEDWVSRAGIVYYDTQNHTEDEHNLPEGERRIKMHYSVCISCRDY